MTRWIAAVAGTIALVGPGHTDAHPCVPVERELVLAGRPEVLGAELEATRKGIHVLAAASEVIGRSYDEQAALLKEEPGKYGHLVSGSIHWSDESPRFNQVRWDAGRLYGGAGGEEELEALIGAMAREEPGPEVFLKFGAYASYELLGSRAEAIVACRTMQSKMALGDAPRWDLGDAIACNDELGAHGHWVAQRTAELRAGTCAGRSLVVGVPWLGRRVEIEFVPIAGCDDEGPSGQGRS